MFVDIEKAKQTGRARFGEMIAHLRADPTTRILLIEKSE
jgi:site-specific DNA recombinase